MMRQFGERRYAFPNGPPAVFYAESETQAQQVLDARDDAVAIGVLGGEFDEHKAEGRLKGVCANDLVAKGLRVDRNRSLKIILREVNRADCEAGQMHFELGQALKTMLSYGNFTDEELTDFVGKFLDAELAKAREFNELCPDDFKRTGKIIVIRGVPVAIVRSDLASMNAYARSMRGARLVVIQREGGNVQIFSQTSHKGFVQWIAREIMRVENWLEGRSREGRALDEESFGQIITTGKGRELPGSAGHWYFHLEAGAILNGSLSHKVAPTRIDLELFEAIVERGMDASVEAGAMYIVGDSPPDASEA